MSGIANDHTPERRADPVEEAANVFIQNSVICMMGGLRSAMPNVPLSILLVKVASALGCYFGQACCIGLLATVLKVRNECKDAFGKGMTSVPIQPPPMAQGKPKLNA